MSLQNDININIAKFSPSAVTEKTKEFNAKLISMVDGQPRWFEVGAEKYRIMRIRGETPFPKPVVLEAGKTGLIPSRDEGRDIPTRIFTPENGQPSKGLFLHIHGGGWVLMSEKDSDLYLKFLADSAQLTVISIGYRLAPEHPFPAGPEDCYDAAEWLVDNAKEHYGAELKVTGGESAGGHLSALVCLHLLQARPSFQFRGLVLNYGAYDLTNFLPQAHHLKNPAVLTYDIMDHFVAAFVPNSTAVSRRHPLISPFYANLTALAAKAESKTLPPALFTCGTEDILLDDTVMMGTKWMMTGAESIVKIYPGAPHGFSSFSTDDSEASRDSKEDTKAFLLAKVRS